MILFPLTLHVACGILRAMSRENVQVVRATFEAWNAGDMEALRKPYDPDVLTRTPEEWPEPGPFVGREATMRWFDQLRDAWDADALELISDFIDAADSSCGEVHLARRGPWP